MEIESMEAEVRIPIIVALLLALTGSAFGATKVFIEKNGGFQDYLAAAMIKKHVPIEVVTKKADADYVLQSVDHSFQESAGSKIARCLFAYCAGMNGVQTASVQLVKISGDTVVWAYTVKKARAGNYQSTAEAVAKHLKKFLNSHPL